MLGPSGLFQNWKKTVSFQLPGSGARNCQLFPSLMFFKFVLLMGCFKIGCFKVDFQKLQFSKNFDFLIEFSVARVPRPEFCAAGISPQQIIFRSASVIQFDVRRYGWTIMR